MKKRIYIPDNIVILVVNIIFAIFGLPVFAQGIIVLISAFSLLIKLDVLHALLGFGISTLLIFVSLLIGYKISQYMCYTIILDKEKIYIHKDTNPRKRKIQYYTEVNYTEITSIEIFESNKKSNGKKSGEDSITGGAARIPYLCLHTKSGEQKLFMIMFTSKKSIKKLIIELKHRMELCGNSIQTEDVDTIIRKI